MVEETMPGRYGFMNGTEYDFIDRLLDRIKAEWHTVRFLEIGVCGGYTVGGIARRCNEIDCHLYAAGVDCMIGQAPDRALFPDLPEDYAFYCGDSMDQWRGVTGTFNLLLVDGCHCVIHSMCDFLNYSPLVEVIYYITRK